MHRSAARALSADSSQRQLRARRSTAQSVTVCAWATTAHEAHAATDAATRRQLVKSAIGKGFGPPIGPLSPILPAFRAPSVRWATKGTRWHEFIAKHTASI